MTRLASLFPISAAATLCGVALLWAGADNKGPADLNLTDMSGHKVHLRDFRGSIVVVNFWATWCGPCNEEMPLLVETEKNWSSDMERLVKLPIKV